MAMVWSQDGAFGDWCPHGTPCLGDDFVPRVSWELLQDAHCLSCKTLQRSEHKEA